MSRQLSLFNYMGTRNPRDESDVVGNYRGVPGKN